MLTISPYLNFNGNTEEVFNFYKSVFGGEFTTFQRFKDVPSELPTSASAGEKIMHVALPISKEVTLMGSDTHESFGAVKMGTNFSLSINTDTKKDTDRIFNALAAGGQITMPLEKTFWGAYFGMLTDKFGIQWMVNCQLQ